MRKRIWWLGLGLGVGGLGSVALAQNAFNTPIKLDASGYLNVSATGSGSPSPNQTITLGNAPLKLDASGYLLVNCASGCGGGASSLPSNVQGDLFYGSGVNTVTTLSKSTSVSRVLCNTGASNAPAWCQPDLATAASGTLAAAQFPALTGDVTTSAGNLTTAIGAGKVTNTMLAGSIAYSKLSLTGAILNADLAGSITEGKFAFTDITTANASTSAHGLLIKGDANVAHCLSGNITWVACGSGGTPTFYQTLGSQTNVFADSPVTVSSTKGIYYCNAASGNITYNLPAVASSTDFIFTFIKTDSTTNSCTLDGSGVESINGAATYVVNSQYSGLTIHTTGSTGWTGLMTAGVSFPDPGADKILYFRNSDKSIQPVTVGGNLSFSAGTLDATVGASSTNTFTNKTLDVEGTGNVVSMPFYMLFNTAACQGSTASNGFNIQASGNATVACNGTTITQGLLTFPDASTSEVQIHVVLPADWDSTLATELVGKWRTSATSGNAVWQVSGVCMTDGAVIPTSYNSTADTVTDAAKGTTLQANTFTLALSTAANHALASCSAGDDLYLRFFRDPSHGSDTITANADLLSLALRYRRTM